MYFKVENPPGNRIQEFYVGEEKAKLDKEYDAAFITSQGISEKYGTKRKDLDIRAIDAMKRYIEENDPISVELDHNMVPI